MSEEPSSRDKAQLRRLVRERLAALDPVERRRRGAAALGRLLALPEVRRARDVLLFRSLPDEIDTAPAFERLLALGKAVFAPRVRGPELVFVRVHAGTSWITGGSPAAEPDSDERWDVAAGAVAIVPGLAFSERGGRLGRGGGFYDRFLAAASVTGHVVAVGIALEEQVFEVLPLEAHDAPVAVVVTDRRTLR